MADPRFFRNRGPFRLGELAALSDAELGGDADPERQVEDLAPLDLAGPGELSFLDNPHYLDTFRNSRAGACVVAPAHAAQAPAGMTLLLSDEPYRAYARIAQAFYPPHEVAPGIAASAMVDAAATIGEGCEIAAGAVVEAGAELGRGCRIGPNAVIGLGVVLGESCRVGANASLSHCLVGDRVTIHPGVRIGQDGFGFAADPAGHMKVPQVGRVLIGDDCEIGANSTIDRGANRDTVIGAGCWIDNLVQIGHNVELGKGCIIVAMAGISGSTKLGDFVAVGGQAGITGHLTIGSGARIGAQCGVMADVPAGATMAGSPAMPIKEFFRQVAVVRRLVQERGRER